MFTFVPKYIMNMSKEDTLALINIIDYYIKIYQEALNWYSQLDKWYYRLYMWFRYGDKDKDGIYLKLLEKVDLQLGICYNAQHNQDARNMIDHTVGWYIWGVFIINFVGLDIADPNFLNDDYPFKAYIQKTSVIQPIIDRIERLKYMRDKYESNIS